MRGAAVAVAALCTATRAATPPEELTVLLYDSAKGEASAFEKQLQSGGWRWSKIGQDDRWEGFGTKVRGTIRALADLEPASLVVVTDAYDVLLNPLPDAAQVTARKVAAAVANRPGAIIVSAESQCCVNALSRAEPGTLIAENGTRTGRACSSRSADCGWRVGGETPWVEFMTSLARSRGPRSGDANPFLNAGVVAGRARDLLAMYSALKVDNNEDDQALMTEYLFRYPEKITLDYDQELFGNNRWRKGEPDGCMFEKAEGGGHLVHRETQTNPAFLHTSGQFWGCYRTLAEAAGVQLPAEAQRRQAQPLGYGYTQGDPFTSYAGKRTQFYLPLGEEVELLTCGNVVVHGRTMASGVAGDAQQWFDKVRITEVGIELVSVEVQAQKVITGKVENADEDDATVASEATRIQKALSLLRKSMHVEKPEQLTTIAVNVSGTPKTHTTVAALMPEKVVVQRDTTQPFGTCCFSELVNVTTGGFSAEVRSSMANKFHTAADKMGKLHLDIVFTKVDVPTCKGLLPEIWGVRPLTSEHAKLLSP